MVHDGSLYHNSILLTLALYFSILSLYFLVLPLYSHRTPIALPSYSHRTPIVLPRTPTILPFYSHRTPMYSHSTPTVLPSYFERVLKWMKSRFSPLGTTAHFGSPTLRSRQHSIRSIATRSGLDWQISAFPRKPLALSGNYILTRSAVFASTANYPIGLK